MIAPEKIVMVYRMIKDKKTIKETSQETGVAPGSISHLCERFENALKMVKDGRVDKIKRNYQRAVAIYHGENLATHYLPEEVKEPTDRFEALDKATKEYMKQVEVFIISEVEERVAKVQIENKKLSEKIKELEQVQELAKTTNYVGNLRKHFGFKI